MGFFKASLLTGRKPPPSQHAKCGACGLYKQCHSPKMPPSGSGKKKILIVAEAPGENEDKKGVQLVGNSGRYLEKQLRSVGVEMRRDCLLTNTLICRPPNNRTPKPKEIGYCQPNLLQTIRKFKPRVIIPLGGPAVRSLIGHCWGDDAGPISRWVGFQIPDQKTNAWICPTYHPSWILREHNPVLEVLFRKHLQDMVSKAKEGRPWSTVPDYQSQVEVETDPTKASKWLRHCLRKGGPIAFDYETNMLKPDNASRRIVSASVCWRGKRTLAFPWVGEVRGTMRELLRSPPPKIASNIKFEERWTWAVLKTRVRNWLHDTVLQAHVFDRREGITGLKFQSYLWLGQACYNAHIDSLLSHTSGKHRINRIDEIDLHELLIYGGLDSLLAYEVAMYLDAELG